MAGQKKGYREMDEVHDVVTNLIGYTLYFHEK